MDAYQTDPEDRRSRWSEAREGSWLGWALAIGAGIIVVAAAFFFLGGGEAPRVAIADLDDPASPMTGEAVTVEGEVEEALTGQAITVSDPDSDEPLLVIARSSAVVDGMAPGADVQPVDPVGGMDAGGGLDQGAGLEAAPLPPPELPSTGPVRVIGTVDTFDRATVAEEQGITLDEGTFGAWDGSPFLLADQVDTEFEPTTPAPAEPSVNVVSEG